jgi:hypothetical protein
VLKGFDDRDSGTVGASLYREYASKVMHLGVTGQYQCRSRRILCRLERYLAAQQADTQQTSGALDGDP